MRDKVIKAMAEQLGVSQEAQEEQLAKMIEAPASRYAWQKAMASKSDENLIVEDSEEDKAFKAAGPHWLSELTGTAPLKATKEDSLLGV